MRYRVVLCLVILFPLQNTDAQVSTLAAARKSLPGVSWRAGSVVAADFTCRGRLDRAILGTEKSAETGKSNIVVAVFVNGTGRPPEVIRDGGRDAQRAKLTTESLDYDPEVSLGYPLPGFQRSKTCKGLNISDGETDSRHLYWNHIYGRFDSWSL